MILEAKKENKTTTSTRTERLNSLFVFTISKKRIHKLIYLKWEMNHCKLGSALQNICPSFAFSFLKIPLKLSQLSVPLLLKYLHTPPLPKTSFLSIQSLQFWPKCLYSWPLLSKLPIIVRPTLPHYFYTCYSHHLSPVTRVLAIFPQYPHPDEVPNTLSQFRPCLASPAIAQFHLL